MHIHRRLPGFRFGIAAVVTSAAVLSGAGLPANAAHQADPEGEGHRIPVTSRVAVDASTVPPGWTVVPAPKSVRLEWRSDAAIPIGGARVEFWLGQQLLGEARPLRDGHTFRLDVTTPLGPDLESLRVTRGGIPLDEPEPKRSLGSESTPGETALEHKSLPTIASDPGVPGPYATTSSTYELAPLDLAEYPAPVEMLGRVVRPVDATGPLPLVLFLHGRHSTCFKGKRSSGDWPCRTGWEPIPSYLGYLESQRLLASQGYVTVSISANGINGQDWESADGGAEARSRLVRRHLAQWASWTKTGGAPFGSDLVGAVDMDRVVLVGHSRGGEGVNRAAIDSARSPRWTIAGQVLIGPTAFGRQSQPGLNTLVLLPFCDGDVSDLQGQQYVDQSRDIVDDTDPSLRSAVMVMGANHNYFNREWTPGQSVAPSNDDWWGKRDPLCGKTSPERLTPGEQRDVGSTYTAAAAHVFADGNQQELALIDGSPVRASSADPAVVHVTAIGANRSPVYRPARTDQASEVGAVTSRMCYGFGKRPLICDRREASPHFLPMSWQGKEPAPVAWEAAWHRASGRSVMPLRRPVDLSSSEQLELRVAAKQGAVSRFDVVLFDGTGARTDIGTATVRPLPSSRSVGHLWARTIRVPLGARSTDLSDITKVALVPRSGSGHLYVLDIHGRSSGLETVRPQVMPRLDINDAEVVEGDDPEQVANLRINVRGRITVPIRFWMSTGDDLGATKPTSSIVTLSPGDTFIDVPIHYEGNQVDSDDLFFTVMLRALHQSVTGKYLGSLRVLDDDPAPLATVTPAATAVEGEPLRWTVSLDKPSGRYVGFDFRLVKPAYGTEMSTDDVSERWLNRCGRVPAIPKPLSQARIYCTTVGMEPGVTDGDLVIPTAVDDRAEGDEFVAWKLVWGYPILPDPPWHLTGKVSDQ